MPMIEKAAEVIDPALDMAKRRHRHRVSAIKRLEISLLDLECDLNRERHGALLRHRFMVIRRELRLLRDDDEEQSARA